MIPRSVIDNLQCAVCFRIYVYLDERQGLKGRAVRGKGAIEKALGLDARAVKHHLLDHLSPSGLIHIEPNPLEPGVRWSECRFPVAHNPARARRAPTLRTITGVWDEPKTTYRGTRKNTRPNPFDVPNARHAVEHVPQVGRVVPAPPDDATGCAPRDGATRALARRENGAERAPCDEGRSLVSTSTEVGLLLVTEEGEDAKEARPRSRGELVGHECANSGCVKWTTNSNVVGPCAGWCADCMEAPF
jgi:hypothetical protein